MACNQAEKDYFDYELETARVDIQQCCIDALDYQKSENYNRARQRGE